MNRDDFIPGRPSPYTGRAADDDAEHCAAVRRWGADVPHETMAEREAVTRVRQVVEYRLPIGCDDEEDLIDHIIAERRREVQS